MKSALHSVLVALAASALIGSAGVASAASAPARPSSDDLRPLYATSADIAEGKRVAETSCGSCHGVNGVSAAAGVPHVAGQRAGYIYAELKAYRSGGRSNPAMSGAVKFLSDDALLKAAAYYSNMDPAPPAAPAPGRAAARPDPLQAGKAASAGCAGCHGDTGTSKTPGTPSLAGLDPEYLVVAMKAYKVGQRKNDVMKGVLAATTDAEMSNLALYYATQPRGAAASGGGNAAAGKDGAAACGGCHDQPTGKTPSLAAQDGQYLAAALKSYKDGSRADETMKGLAASLDDTGARNVAAFYAAQKLKSPSVKKPLSVAELAERCDRCHGFNGNSTDPRLPMLAGQRIDYLDKVLTEYRKGERASPEMAAMSSILTESDVPALAEYYARQKPRAVLYVPMPAK